VSGAGPDESLFDIYTLTGLIFTIVCYTFPYVFILVANALDRMPGELEDASSMLGASTWQTARRITVPLALPTLLAGALIAFLQALNLFGSPAILAIPAGFHTLTTKIWSLFEFRPKPELAAASALPCSCSRWPCCAPSRWCWADVAMPCWAASTVRLGVIRLGGLRIPSASPGHAGIVAAAVPALCGAVQHRLLAGRLAVRDAVDIHSQERLLSRSAGSPRRCRR